MSDWNAIEKNENLPAPDAALEVDMSKPVKVFILLGQSNMLGFGTIAGNSEGCLDYTVDTKGRFTHLRDTTDSGSWTVRKNVRNVFVSVRRGGGMDIKMNDWLTVKGRRIGPEIQLGSILGEAYGNGPVLILKSCIGNRSLGWDLLPPGSERYEYDGKIYAGYKDTPSSWDIDDENPKTVNWYAGKQWDDDTQHAKNVLADINKYYPGAQSYEIAGFVFWQGHKDTGSQAYAMKYEENLVRFIKALRTEFHSPEAKFLCATVGHHGYKMKGRSLMVCEAQLAVSSETGKYPEFENNVQSVDTRSTWRDVGPKNAGPHYNENAETYMEVGDLIGWSMLELLMNHPPTNPKIIQVGAPEERVEEGEEEEDVGETPEPEPAPEPEAEPEEPKEETEEDQPEPYVMEELPRPLPDMEVDMSKPVKVVIMLGDTLMFGQPPIHGENKVGSLEYSMKEQPNKYKHFIDDDGNLIQHKNVREINMYTKPDGKLHIATNHILEATGHAKRKVYPGIQLGAILGNAWGNDSSPVLILKVCFTSTLLGFEMLPPGSKQYEYNNEIYAGYKDYFRTYTVGEEEDNIPMINKYAGYLYDWDIGNIKLILSNLDQYYPGATSYEIISCIWWHGERENIKKGYIYQYETHLVNLIKSLQNDLPMSNDAKILIGITPHTTHIGKELQILIDGQNNVNGSNNDNAKYPEFNNIVKTINFRSVWKPPRVFGHVKCEQADVYMEVGDIMGRSLLQFLIDAPIENPIIVNILEELGEKDESDDDEEE